jgi:hypothetical protein
MAYRLRGDRLQTSPSLFPCLVLFWQIQPYPPPSRVHPLFWAHIMKRVIPDQQFLTPSVFHIPCTLRSDEEGRSRCPPGQRGKRKGRRTECIRLARMKSRASRRVRWIAACSLDEAGRGEGMSARKWTFIVGLRFPAGCFDWA